MTKPALTIERLERALDLLAAEIVDFGDRGRELLPMYRRLERELAAMKADNDLMTSVRDRLKQSKSQTAVRSS